MIKIEVSNDMLRFHKKYFETNILPNLKSEYSKSTGSYKRIIEILIDNWEDVAVGTLDKLKDINNEIIKYKLTKNEQTNLYNLFGYDNFKAKNFYTYYKCKVLKRYPGLSSSIERDRITICKEIIKSLKRDFPDKIKEIETRIEKPYISRKDKLSFLKKQIEKVIVVDITLQNFRKYNIFGEEWNPYYFVFLSGLTSCPYCNRQYITPVFSDQRKTRATLDHFLPKKNYPYFSMSLYNLVPSCSTCNSSLKNTIKTDFDDLNPYSNEIGNLFSFKIDIVKDNTIIIESNSPIYKKVVEKYVDTFGLETLYNYHRDIAKRLLRIKYKFSDKQIHDLYESHKDIFYSEEDLRNHLVGKLLPLSKYNNEPLAKFKYDIVKDLGLIK